MILEHGRESLYETPEAGPGLGAACALGVHRSILAKDSDRLPTADPPPPSAPRISKCENDKLIERAGRVVHIHDVDVGGRLPWP